MSKEQQPLPKGVQALQLDIDQVTRTKSILNPNQIQKLWNSTRAVYKYQRPAKGGGQWTYVKASYVRKVLDSVFGFNWDFVIETSLSEAFEVAKMTRACVVKGTLKGRVLVDGKWVEIQRTQFGRSDVKFLTETKNGVKSIKYDDFTGAPLTLDFGNDMKAATSDALKKCASLMGIAADVYEAEEFQAIEITGSSEASDRTKETKKQVERAKAIIKIQGTKGARQIVDEIGVKNETT